MFIAKKNINKFQQGGEMAPREAPVEQAPVDGGQDQMMAQLQQMAAEIIQQMGPEAAMALAQMIMEMVQQAGAPAEQGQPVFRKGGKLVRRDCKDGAIKKNCNGGKATR